MTTITVFLIDASPDVLQCYKSILAQDDRIKIIGSNSNIIDSMNFFDDVHPDIIIAPIDNNVANIRFLISSINVKVLATSLYKDSRIAVWALNSGVSGYILKDHAHEYLLKAIYRIAAGRIFISPGIAGIPI